MGLKEVCNYGILLFTPAMAWLMSCRNVKVQRWGHIVGFVGQPFWLILMYKNGDFGPFFMSCFYTVVFVRGIYNYWILPLPQKDKCSRCGRTENVFEDGDETLCVECKEELAKGLNW